MDFNGLIPFFWALLGLVLLGAEFIVPGFIIFFFGLGGLLNGGLLFLFPALRPRLPLQIILWLSMSGFSLFTLRRYFAKIFKGTIIGEKGDSDMAGDRAVVVEEITPQRGGRIKFQGTTWNAVSFTENLKEGETVEILKKEDLTFYVTRSITDPDTRD